MLTIEVPAYYPPNCKVVFIGESPGYEEAKQGVGWVGAAGKVLQRAASVAGLDWSSVGKSNIVKRKLPNNKFKDCFYETIEEPTYTKTGKLSKVTKKIVRPTEEYNKWISALRIELQAQHPNLIVACGNEALQALTEVSGITNYRGSILPDKWGDNFKVLAVEHPYDRFWKGQFLNFWILCSDLRKAKREMEFPQIRREPYIAIIKPELQQIQNELEYIRINPNMKYTLDVETRAGTLACFALGYPTPKQLASICIPIQTISGPYWSPEDELDIWRALSVTAKANPNLCNQNIEYDIDYLLQYGVEPSGILVDTMLLHSLLYPEFPKDLGFLGSFYLDDVVWWKSNHRDWSKGTADEALWAYNCKDAVYTLRIVDKQIAEAKRRGIWKLYHGSDTETNNN